MGTGLWEVYCLLPCHLEERYVEDHPLTTELWMGWKSERVQNCGSLNAAESRRYVCRHWAEHSVCPYELARCTESRWGSYLLCLAQPVAIGIYAEPNFRGSVFLPHWVALKPHWTALGPLCSFTTSLTLILILPLIHSNLKMNTINCIRCVAGMIRFLWSRYGTIW
jgi:hypothetical protein